MSHEEALNLLLANSCRNGDDVFTFDLHCMEAKVTAKMVSTYKTIQFEIVSVEFV